nr:MAG TPA: hypothetical protein [Caudoviricetes sp.]
MGKLQSLRSLCRFDSVHQHWKAIIYLEVKLAPHSFYAFHIEAQ